MVKRKSRRRQRGGMCGSDHTLKGGRKKKRKRKGGNMMGPEAPATPAPSATPATDKLEGPSQVDYIRTRFG